MFTVDVNQQYNNNNFRISVCHKSGLTDGFLLLRSFSVAISVSPHVCLILVLILIFMSLR